MTLFKKPVVCIIGMTVAAGLGIVHFQSHAQSSKKRDFSKVVKVQYYRDSAHDVITLKIPEGYIRRIVVGPRIEGVRDTLYLEALGPELLPQTENNQTLFSFPANLSTVFSLQVSSLYRLRPDQIEERTQDLFRLLSQNRSAPCQWSTQTNIIYGLHHITIDPVSCPQQPLYAYGRKDLYQVKTSNDKLATVIRCTPMEWTAPDPSEIDGVTPMPGTRCNHWFSVAKFNSRVKLHYHRDFLPYWREIEGSVERTLASFVEP